MRSILKLPVLVICCLWLVVARVSAQPPKDLPPSKVGDLIEPLVKAHAGDVAVAVRHLATGEHYEWNADRPQATASLIKLPIMIEAYRQAVEEGKGLHRVIEIPKAEMVEGSGILTAHFSAVRASPCGRYSTDDGLQR